eukprot:SAG11_NODE_2410_length_3394_cov_2.519575_2_plen_91_part_00
MPLESAAPCATRNFAFSGIGDALTKMHPSMRVPSCASYNLTAVREVFNSAPRAGQEAELRFDVLQSELRASEAQRATEAERMSRLQVGRP